MAHLHAAIGAAILSFFLLVAVDAAPPPSGAPTTTFSLQNACKQIAELYDLCMATLRSYDTADTVGLARAAIVAVQKNASETSTYLSNIYDDHSLNKTAQVQQCIEGCGERYESAVEQLTDAVTALNTGAYGESEALVAASQAEVRLCHKGCQAVLPDNRNILAARNRDVDRLCSIALTITKLMLIRRSPASAA